MREIPAKPVKERAYNPYRKPMEEIIDTIGDTADTISVIKPLYNFKAVE